MRKREGKLKNESREKTKGKVLGQMGKTETDKLERKERNKIRRWTNGAEKERNE